MIEAANGKGHPKVFIIKTEYGYTVTPSPVVVPRRRTTVDFENLTKVPAKISIPGIPGKYPLTSQPQKTISVTLPSRTKRVISYTVEMKGGLLARGNSAPTIIRDP